MSLQQLIIQRGIDDFWSKRPDYRYFQMTIVLFDRYQQWAAARGHPCTNDAWSVSDDDMSSFFRDADNWEEYDEGGNERPFRVGPMYGIGE